jgi:uncharacterized membrane protein YedE/YeeE
MRSGRYWSPYVAGTLLGLTLLAAFFIAGRGLGASGAFSVVTASALHAAAPGYAERLTYFSRYLESPLPLLDWNFFLILGVFAGALAGALLSRNFRWTFDKSDAMTARTRFLTALVGGMFIGFASRLARGCTSGVALTGGAQLALAGWVFVIAMFAAGFLFAALFRRYWS